MTALQMPRHHSVVRISDRYQPLRRDQKFGICPSSPAILHSDQGSEYLSYKHQELCDKMEIQLSASNKSSPWQNGFMERWFGGFKREMGNLAQHKDLSQLHEAIAMQIYYYIHTRIHSALKMSPAAYAATLQTARQGVR